MAIRHLAILLPGNYRADDPLTGLQATLDVIRLAEDIGIDSAWVRQRHLERGISSAATFLAAATQRTRSIGLGVAVIQMGYENPFRLAEDLATVDVLSRGRLQVGLSAGAPVLASLLGGRFHDTGACQADYSHARVARLRDNLSGEPIGPAQAVIESLAGQQRPQVQPHAAGLAQRLWYGAGSVRSVLWAARESFHLLIGNITTAEGSSRFLDAQQRQLDAYEAEGLKREHAVPLRVALGRVIVPWDSADPASRRRYEEFARSRHARTLAPQGERGTLFCPDFVGDSDSIVERLLQDPVLARVEELRLELPYDLEPHEYAQILHDTTQRIAPALGWKPDGRRTALQPNSKDPPPSTCSTTARVNVGAKDSMNA